MAATLLALRPGQYAGLSYQQASQKALHICAVAAQTGQTWLAAEHLNELVGIMRSQLKSVA
jgi:hypothetical protein